MSPQEARALAMAHELQALLADLAQQQGPGSCAEDAHFRMHDVIGMLEPDPPPEKIDVTTAHPDT